MAALTDGDGDGSATPTSGTPPIDIAVVGLGVIGGSAALRILKRGTRVRGYSDSDADREAAASSGMQVARTIEAAVRDVGLVLLAVPLDALPAVADAVITAAPEQATLLHAGSLQRVDALSLAPRVGARLIGTHPLAGSHRSGFSAASPDLFRGAVVFVERRAGARQREDAELFWSMAGAGRVEYLDAETHDDMMSVVSHLPQLAATALADTLSRARPSDRTSYVGPGGRDATRLAMSNFAMWRPILERAPDATAESLRELESVLAELREALERRDWHALADTWDRAGGWRAQLEDRSRSKE